MIKWNENTEVKLPPKKEIEIRISQHGGPFEGPGRNAPYKGERSAEALRNECIKIYQKTWGDAVTPYYLGCPDDHFPKGRRIQLAGAGSYDPDKNKKMIEE